MGTREGQGGSIRWGRFPRKGQEVPLEAGSPRPSLAVWPCPWGPWLVEAGGWTRLREMPLTNLGVVSKTLGAFR